MEEGERNMSTKKDKEKEERKLKNIIFIFSNGDCETNVLNLNEEERVMLLIVLQSLVGGIEKSLEWSL